MKLSIDLRILATIVFSLSLFMAPVTVTAADGGLVEGGADQSVDTVTTGGMLLKGARYVTDDSSGDSTISTTFVPVPNMSLSFTHGQRGTLIITFSAVSYAGGGELEYVDVQIDGASVAPGEIQWDGDSAAYATARSFTWIADDVSAGPHTVEVMYRSFGGAPVFMHWRTLVVHSKS
jgi:hypothetical protein